MKKRILTSIIVVLSVALAVVSKLLPYSIGDYIFDIFILSLSLIATIEINNIMDKMGKKINRYMSVFYPVVNYIVLLISIRFVQYEYLVLLQLLMRCLYFIIALICEVIVNKNDTFKNKLINSLNTIVTCIYPGFMLALLLNVNHIDIFAGVAQFSIPFIIIVFAITWLTDTCAFLVGCTLKGPKLCPKISPNKTISGAIGGLLGGIAGSMLIYGLLCWIPAWNNILSVFGLAWWHFLLIGLFASVFCQFGDLFESKIKRNAGIKDSGNILPGHGGMLDRIDAMIFCVVFIFIVSLVIII